MQLKAWWAIVISDAMEDIRSMILANAENRGEGMDVFESGWRNILVAFEKGNFSGIERELNGLSKKLRSIRMKRPPESVPRIYLAGEIFVRRDGLSRRYLTEYLAEKGFVTICSPITEWMLYSDYLVDKGLVYDTMSIRERLQFAIKKKMRFVCISCLQGPDRVDSVSSMFSWRI